MCWHLVCVDFEPLTMLVIIGPMYLLSPWPKWRTLASIAQEGEGLFVCVCVCVFPFFFTSVEGYIKFCPSNMKCHQTTSKCHMPHQGKSPLVDFGCQHKQAKIAASWSHDLIKIRIKPICNSRLYYLLETH